MSLFVRYFCEWGDPAYEYYLVIKSCGVDVRVVALNGVLLSEGRWSAYSSDFIRPVPPDYIDVVCMLNGFDEVRHSEHATVLIITPMDDEPSEEEIDARLQRRKGEGGISAIRSKKELEKFLLYISDRNSVAPA